MKWKKGLSSTRLWQTQTSLAIPKALLVPCLWHSEWEHGGKLMWRCSKPAVSQKKRDTATKAPSHHTFSSKPRPDSRCSTGLSQLKWSLQQCLTLHTWLPYVLFLWEQASWERRHYHDAVTSSNHLEGSFGGHLVQSWSGTSTITRTCQLCLCLAESWKVPRIELSSYLWVMFFTVAQAP